MARSRGLALSAVSARAACSRPSSRALASAGRPPPFCAGARGWLPKRFRREGLVVAAERRTRVALVEDPPQQRRPLRTLLCARQAPQHVGAQVRRAGRDLEVLRVLEGPPVVAKRQRPVPARERAGAEPLLHL